MNVREDLLSDMVATLYKDEARIKQLIALVEAAYKEGAELSCWDDMLTDWPNSDAYKQLQALKE